MFALSLVHSPPPPSELFLSALLPGVHGVRDGGVAAEAVQPVYRRLLIQDQVPAGLGTHIFSHARWAAHQTVLIVQSSGKSTRLTKGSRGGVR